VERAPGGSSGRYACAIGTHRQTHQCRISYRRLDPADQHHDAGASPGARIIGVAPAGIGIGTGSERAIAVTASGVDHNPCAGGGQKAVRAETSARGFRTGSTGARSAGSCSGGARARGHERLMLSKAFAAR
jgi:hypothetical protein